MNIRELVQRINDFYRVRHTDNVIDTDPNDLVLPGFISGVNGVFSYNGQGAEERVLSELEQMRLDEALRQNINLANYLRRGLILRNQAVQDNQGQDPDNQERHPDNNGGRGSVRNRRTKYRRSSKSSRAKRSKKMRRTRHRKRT